MGRLILRLLGTPEVALPPILWGETIGTVMTVSNVSFEGVFRRFLRFNGERRKGLRNVSDVSRSRGFSIRRLRCVHFSRLMRAHLHSLLPINFEDEPIAIWIWMDGSS